MSFLTILLTGFGVSMDAVAVSISSGMTAPPRRRHALKMAVWFAAFQALMPAAGFLLGVAFRDWVTALDHWIAFGLLGVIGAKMIRESLGPAEERCATADCFATRRVAALAVATSVDALAVGVSLSLLDTGLLTTVGIIGLTTLALCYPAVLLGRRLGAAVSRRAELVGGVVLVAIGLKILVEHTLFGA